MALLNNVIVFFKLFIWDRVASFMRVLSIVPAFVSFVRLRIIIHRISFFFTVHKDVFLLNLLLDMALNHSIEFMGWVFAEFWDFSEGRWLWVENYVLLIWLILMDWSQLKARWRHVRFMSVEDHFFDQGLFLMWRKVRFLVSFAFLWFHFFFKSTFWNLYNYFHLL